MKERRGGAGGVFRGDDMSLHLEVEEVVDGLWDG